MKKIIYAIVLLSAALTAHAQNRIISAGSSITELILALDAQKQLVAIDITSRDLDDSGQLPQIGYHRQLSAEGLLALNPTHLIGSEVMGPQNTLTLLENAQVEVISVPSGDSKKALFARIDKIAEITQKQPQAEQLKISLSKQFQKIENRQVAQSPKVLFAMVSKGRPMTVAGKETTIDVIISNAGASNPASELMESYKPLSTEAIVELQPDYLLVSQRAWDELGGHKGILEAFPLLQATPAAQEEHIIPIASSAIIGGFGIESISLSETLYHAFHPTAK